MRASSWIFSLLFIATSASAGQYSLPSRTITLPSDSEFPATYEISAELKRQKVELKGDNAHLSQVDLRVRGGKPGVTVGLFLGRGVVDTVTLTGGEQTISLVNNKGKALVPWILVVRNGGLQIVEMRVVLDADSAAPAPAPAPAPVEQPKQPEPAPAPAPAPAPVQPKPAPAPAPVQPKPAPAPAPVKPVPAPAPVQPKPVPAPTPVTPAPAPTPVTPVPAPAPAPVKPVKPNPLKSASGRWSANQTIYYVDSRTNRAYLGRISGISADGRNLEVSVTRKGQVTVDENSNRIATTNGGCARRICAGEEATTYDSRGIIRDVVVIGFQPGGYAIVKVLSTGDLIGNWPLTALGRSR